MSDSVVVPLERIQDKILVVRGQRVLLDADLAAIFGVSTKQLNQAVKRNKGKFPEDFMFELKSDEFRNVTAFRNQTIENEDDANLRSQTVTARRSHGGRRKAPYDFTEHGTIQAANVLRSDTAVQMSVQVVRAFVQLRQLVVNHKAIRTKLSELDARIGEHDEQLARLLKPSTNLPSPFHRAKNGASDSDAFEANCF